MNCSVFTHPVPENKSGQYVVDVLQKRLENLGAQKSGAFAVDCDAYHSLPGVPGGPGIFQFKFVISFTYICFNI